MFNMKELIIANMLMPFLLGMLLCITIRWIYFSNCRRGILADRKKKYPRLVRITDAKILEVALRNRGLNVYRLLPSTDKNSLARHADKFKSIMPPENREYDTYAKMPLKECEIILSLFSSTRHQISLIPNEDIVLMIDNGEISNWHEYYCNQDIMKALRPKNSKVAIRARAERIGKIRFGEQLEELQSVII